MASYKSHHKPLQEERSSVKNLMGPDSWIFSARRRWAGKKRVECERNVGEKAPKAVLTDVLRLTCFFLQSNKLELEMVFWFSTTDLQMTKWRTLKVKRFCESSVIKVWMKCRSLLPFRYNSKIYHLISQKPTFSIDMEVDVFISIYFKISNYL